MEKLRVDGATVQGFYCMFSTWLKSRHANPDVVGACLAHTPADKT
jgi:hypothetical protein